MHLKNQIPSPTHQLELFGGKSQAMELKQMVKSRFIPKIIYQSLQEDTGNSRDQTQRGSRTKEKEKGLTSTPSFMQSNSNVNCSIKSVILKRKTLLPKKISAFKMQKLRNEMEKTKENTKIIERTTKNSNISIRPNNFFLNNWCKPNLEASTNFSGSFPRTTLYASFIQ